MKEHLKDNMIKNHWDNAQGQGSYYCLTTEIIDNGACHKIKNCDGAYNSTN